VPSFGFFANVGAISMQDNDKLCGGIPDINLPLCSFQLPKKKHMLFIIPIVLTTAATLHTGIALPSSHYVHEGKNKNPFNNVHACPPFVSYALLAIATDDFMTINLLVSRSFGIVYKGNLHDESGESSNLVAIKMLKLQSPGSIKSFRAECEALRYL
jgi:receptor kinase-like protein